MKLNSLTTAVIAGIAGVAGIANMAGAVNLNPDGLGQVLIYPYYTVRGGNGTLLSVVNTHPEGKAVKVRFLEGYDSREVLDFNLYLSQYDVWVAQVYDNGSGGSVATNDNSCTVPAFQDTLAGGIKAQKFTNLGYAQGAYGTSQGTDNGPTNLDRTREGYVEMIEMGVVTNATKGSLTALTHVSKVPAKCSQLIAAWSPGGYWAASDAASAIDMTTPSGGLFGAGSVINVSEGTIAAYDADAVDGFSTTVLHTNPGSLSPNLASANFVGAGQAPGGVTSYVFNNGVLVTSNFSFGIDAVSSVFTAQHVYNEYVTDQLVGASSEWVVTFPTKRFYVDPAIVDTALAPFENLFDETSCFGIGLSYYDREETAPVGQIGFSPPPLTGATQLCYEAQAVTFNQDSVAPGVASAILGSLLASNVDVYTSGWLDLSFPNGVLAASIEGNVFNGLPVTGFLVTNYVNAHAAPGILGNYSGLYRHRISREVTSGTPAG